MTTPATIHPDAVPVVSALYTAATDADETYVVMPYAPNEGEVLEVKLVNGATVTGSATNYNTWSFENLTTSTVIATVATNSTPTGDITADTAFDIPVVATAEDRIFVRGDRLGFKKTHTSGGAAMTEPAYVQVNYLFGRTAHGAGTQVA